MFKQIFSLFVTVVGVLFFVPNIWMFKTLAQIKNVFCKLLLSGTLLMIFVPVASYFLFWLIMYRMILLFILWLTHNGRFSKMLKGCNRIYAVQESSPHVVLFLVKCQTESVDFYQKMCETIKTSLKKNFKQKSVFVTLDSFLGYDYLLKNEAMYVDYIKPFPTIIDDKMDNKALLMAIEEHAHDNLPRGNKGLWDISIGMQEINWKNTGEAFSDTFYPIVLRFNPCVSNVFKIVNKLLDSSPASKETSSNENSNIDCSSKVCDKLKEVVNHIYHLFLAPAVYFLNVLALCNEPKIENFLHGQVLCNKKIFLVKDESKPEYVGIIENIKKKIPDTTSQDIIIAAFAASFEKYYSEVSSGNTVATPNIILRENVVYRSNTNVKEDPSNRISQVMLRLPIRLHCNSGEELIVKMLENIKYQRNRMADDVEAKVHEHIMSAIFTYLPSPLLRIIMNQFNFTAFVNNTPCPMKIREIDGCTISNMYSWTPHRGSTGISLTFATYDERLQLSLSVDKVLIENKADVQGILNEVYENLKKLNNAVKEKQTTV